MPMKEKKEHYMTVVLCMLLVGILGGALSVSMRYYTGADYAAASYVKKLNERDYKGIVRMLEREEVQQLGGEEWVVHYYEKIYEKQQQLTGAQIIGSKDGSYRLRYSYRDHQETGDLKLNKKKNRWRVSFPFEASSLQVWGPNGCSVYLDGKKLEGNGEGGYRASAVLPGNYLLQVKFPLSTYKDYYQKVKMPEDSRIVLPYSVGSLKVYTAPGLKVRLGSFEKNSSQEQVLFDELLYGEYTLQVTDENGSIRPQSCVLRLNENLKSCSMQSYELTEKGKQQEEAFWKAFYQQYESAIVDHDPLGLEKYIGKKNRRAIIQDFSSWFIDQKDIEKVSFSYEVGTPSFDEKGRLHQEITETALLDNQEQGGVKSYKVKLTWQVTSQIFGSRWTILNRKMLESIVAVQDEEGRWLQY